MKPRPVLDWSITKLHLPLMRVSFDRCPRALISDSFNWPMFPCSRVLRYVLRVLLYRGILWKRGRKKRKRNGMKNWKWETIFVTDRCAEINDLAVSYKKRKRNGRSFYLAISKFWNIVKRLGIDWNRVSGHFHESFEWKVDGSRCMIWKKYFPKKNQKD